MRIFCHLLLRDKPGPHGITSHTGESQLTAPNMLCNLQWFAHAEHIDRWSESWAVSTWSVGSAFIALGASVRDALLVVFFADILSAAVIVLNGRAAARYHVGYPVLARVSFGIYGSYFFVVLRALLGIIWGKLASDPIKRSTNVTSGGVQLFFEGQFISICLRCIFPGWTRIHNGIPAVSSRASR